MKPFILIIVMSLTSIFAYGQGFDKLWKQELRCEDDGKPQSAYAVAEKILNKAIRVHHPGQTLCARLKMAALHQEWAPDSFFTDIKELEALRAAAPQPEAKAVYASLLAEIYEKNRSRSQAEDMVLKGEDMHEWTREQYDSAATENWRLSMQDLPVLSAAKSEDWIPFIQQDEQSKYFKHDLLHVLWNRAKEQNEDIWLGTRQGIAQLAADVVAEYKRLGNREAALLVSLDYVDIQTDESDMKLLKDMVVEYGDLPLCAEVYLRLMEETYDSKESVELGEECIKRYPKYYRIGEVRNKLNDLQSAYITLSARHYYYPGKEYEWILNVRNAQKLTVEILRMPDNYGKEQLPNDTEKAVAAIRRNGTAVSSFTHSLPVADPWVEVRDTITWKALVPGLYSMILTGESAGKEVAKKNIITYTSFVCTRLQPLHQNGMGKQRTIVVDAESGHPIEGATVDFFYSANDRKVSVATLKTNAEGRAILDDGQVKFNGQGIRLERDVSFGDDHYLEPESFYFSKDESESEERTSAYLRLYSDRSIYRPGQMVHVGGILFSQTHWDAIVLEGIEVNLTLRDANGKEVQTQQVATDEMGKLSADFILPSSGLPGEYSIFAHYDAVQGGRTDYVEFQVEEYKRPTFEVTMDDAPDMQWPADSIAVTGKAMGYNGVPVREGQVTGFYRFTYPWRWYKRLDSERMPIDTVTTDENGQFCIRVPLTKVSEEALWGGLMLQVEVDVLSVAGETREGTAYVPLCKKPLRLLLDVPSQQDRDRLKDITIELLSSTSQPTDGVVEWAVYPANEMKRASEEAVLKGNLQSVDKKLHFDINTLRTLPVGQYEFSAKATSGENSDSTSGYFIIFGMDDTRLPRITPNWLYCPDATFNKERPAQVQIGTSFDDVAFYYTIVAGKQVVEEKMITLSDEMCVIEIPYEERFGDGAVFSYIFVKEGKIYKDEEVLCLTQPDRTLKWEWATFRDRLHPGDTETWTLRLRNPDGTPASAQVMATLYDASLDALQPHQWNFFISRAYHIMPLRWSARDYFSSYNDYQRLNFSMKTYKREWLSFDEFDSDWYDGLSFHGGYGRRYMMGGRAVLSDESMPMMAKSATIETDMDMMPLPEPMVATSLEQEDEEESTVGNTSLASSSTAVRTNFNETAAFLPQLMTNDKGEVAIRFTLPESLTTWKLLGIAHTRDLMSTTFQGEAIARKEMMARLFLPRFLRSDDQSGIRATVQNLTEKDLSGKALLEIFDPETERVFLSEKKPFKAMANGECLLTFDYTPDDKCPVVAVRLTAESASFADGEQHYLPILPSKAYITESVELHADSLGTFITDLSSLFNHDSPTATNRRLTIEYTAHPIWHALQALPSLIEPTHDDIISLGTSLQAQALATYIANTTPRLKSLVEIWQREQTQGQPALASRLAQDEEIKQIILDETPWLREAESEADRKARLMELLDISQQENTLTSIAQRMRKRLMPDGGFAWFPGMESSEVMTRVVSSELARLRVMTNDFATLPSAVKNTICDILRQNVAFVARKTAEHVREMKKAEKKGMVISTASLMYLEYVYMTQHAGVSLNKSQQDDVNYLLDHMKGSVADMDNWERAVAAIVMKGDGRKDEARKYYESLLEHTTTTSDHGTFFDYAGGSFNPTSHKIIHHVAAIEAVHEMEPQNESLLKGLRRWLLQQKRTQMWESNICTSDAIYALLLGNEAELQATEPDVITLNYAKRKVDVSKADADEAVAGLGFIKKNYSDGEAPKSVSIERRTDSEAWGAAYATFLTPMTDASASAVGLKIRRELSSTTPKVGDRFTTRYIITADRDYEYVCLRADRAACAEPAEQRSGYCWQNGLGYYRAVRDARTEYFFDRLPKGTYVLEETAFIDRSGTYTTGLTSIRCLYAPEYGGNAAGVGNLETK